MRKLNAEQIDQAKAHAAFAAVNIDKYLSDLGEFSDVRFIKYFDPRSSTGRTKYGDLVYKLFIERLIGGEMNDYVIKDKVNLECDLCNIPLATHKEQSKECAGLWKVKTLDQEYKLNYKEFTEEVRGLFK